MNVSNDKSLKGHAAILVANIFWGLNAPIGKAVLNQFSALSVTTFRMVGAAAAFWLLALFMPKEHIDNKDMLRLFFAALFAVVFNQGLFVFGLSLTSPINASIVTTTTPIITMVVAAIYLKEPITNKKVLGIFIGAMGALTLILSNQHSGGNGGSNHILGDILCLIAQFSFAIYLTVFKDLIMKYSPVTISKWLFVYASICFIPFSYRDVSAIDFTAIPTDLLLQIGYVVLVATFLTYILVMTGQRLLRPTIVSMYNYVQPVVASVVAVIMGMDTFGVKKGIAIGLVFLGVYFVTQSKSKAQLEAEAIAHPRKSSK